MTAPNEHHAASLELEAALTERNAARAAAAEAYARRNAANVRLTLARERLDIARLYPRGTPHKVGDTIVGKNGESVTVKSLALRRGGPGWRPKRGDLFYIVTASDGLSYPLPVERGES